MLFRFTPFLAAAICVAILPTANAQNEKLQGLLDRSPAIPNAMGYVNVGSLDKLMADTGMPRSVVETVDEYWFVADLDLAGARPKWEAGYSTMKTPVDAEKLATKLGGYVEEISDRKVVWSPGQTYFVPGKENRLGILRPADRSLLTQWIDGLKGTLGTPYLQSQANPPEDYLSMMVAIDLDGALSPVPMAKKLEVFDSLKSKSPETVAGILASAKGLTVLIGRRGLNECIVKASFGKSPASLRPVAADLLAEILERAGSSAPEIKTWKVTTKDNTLSLQGPVTESTLSGLLSVFSLQDQARKTAGLSAGESSSRTKAQQQAYQTKSYFDDVTDIVERTRKHKSQTTGALANWNDARARQIDELGTLGVDPDMIQYGTDVAELLRGNALTVREGNIKSGKAKAGESLNSGYYGNGYGYNSTVDYQRVTSAYARGNAYADYKEALNQIDKMTAAVRRAMTEKYQIQF